MNRAADWLQILRHPPNSRAALLRHEYDRLWPALKRLARLYRLTLVRRTRVVAVIGSLGKTTTRRAVHAALNCPDRSFSHSNYGSSLAANVLRLRPWDAHAALEVGIARPGWMAAYGAMIRPDLVVVTSIASDHNRSFPTLVDTRREKVKMVRGLSKEGVAVLNGDDPHVRWMATQMPARIVTFGMHPDNDVRATNIELHEDHVTFDVDVNGTRHPTRSQLQGEHMVYSILAAAAVVHAEGLDVGPALLRTAQLSPTTSRMELITLGDGTRILDDSHKGSVESIRAALVSIATMPARRRVVVLGNVEEPQGKERDVYRELGRQLAGFADVVVCIGKDEMKSLRAEAKRAGMKAEAIHFAGPRISEAIPIVRRIVEPGDLVLVKGAYAQRLRRVVLALLSHEVSCGVKHCTLKVRTCDDCSLLNAPAATFRNPLVSRYVRP